MDPAIALNDGQSLRAIGDASMARQRFSSRLSATSAESREPRPRYDAQILRSFRQIPPPPLVALGDSR
jgi:hypothetical protein